MNEWQLSFTYKNTHTLKKWLTSQAQFSHLLWAHIYYLTGIHFAKASILSCFHVFTWLDERKQRNHTRDYVLIVAQKKIDEHFILNFLFVITLFHHFFVTFFDWRSRRLQSMHTYVNWEWRYNNAPHFFFETKQVNDSWIKIRFVFDFDGTFFFFFRKFISNYCLKYLWIKNAITLI